MGSQQDNAPIGFALVIAAGLATALGASLVYSSYFVKTVNKLFLAGSLGISAGVMLFVSFVEIFFKSNDAFVEEGYKEKHAFSLAVAFFFAGIIFIQLLDHFVHWLSGHAEEDLEEVCRVVLEENETATKKPHVSQGSTVIEEGKSRGPASGIPMRASTGDVKGARDSISGMPMGSTRSDFEVGIKTPDNEDFHKKRLTKMGLMTALAIGIHNFPEGLATFLATLDDPSVGGALAVAIGIHNIPEGLCVAIPIFYATGSRHKAFLWALLSGISEPIGAAIGYAVVVAAGGEISQLAYGILFGIVGGMMVSICIKELLPTAYRYDPKDKVVTYTVVIGMAVMALSLILFQLNTEDEESEDE
mmetsp:Transcript_2954/g.4345  ORF Transcript_2954/g.4345 Transcript_2954/m.4345 type:complete len:360 (+) Transcript_2954:51-1130(+)